MVVANLSDRVSDTRKHARVDRPATQGPVLHPRRRSVLVDQIADRKATCRPFCRRSSCGNNTPGGVEVIQSSRFSAAVPAYVTIAAFTMHARVQSHPTWEQAKFSGVKAMPTGANVHRTSPISAAPTPWFRLMSRNTVHSRSGAPQCCIFISPQLRFSILGQGLGQLLSETGAWRLASLTCHPC